MTHDTADDELYPGRQKMTLAFELARGSYATILIKRVTVSTQSGIESSQEPDADTHEETEATV
jgi:tRNA(Glu) U13 pseudouridine synthase TruD